MYIGYRKSHSNVAAVICERDSSHICKKHPLIFRHLWFSMWPLSTIKVWQPHSWTLQQIRMVVPLWRRVRHRGQCETRYGVSASLSTPPLGHYSFWQRLVLFLTSQDSACARNSRTPQPLRLVSLRSNKSARTSSACIHYVAIHEGPLTPHPPPCIPQPKTPLVWLIPCSRVPSGTAQESNT